MKDVAEHVHWLLMDVSNQRTKWASFVDGKMGAARAVPTAEVIESFRMVAEDYAGVVMASVVPAIASAIEACCAELDIAVVRANAATVGAMGWLDFSSYDGRETLGEDRIANVLGALSHADDAEKSAVLAVDLGTATTLESAVLVDGLWTFSGGMIAPGVNALGTYLHEKTAQLPRIDPAFKGGIEFLA